MREITEEKAVGLYGEAVDRLREVIMSGHRGSWVEVLQELEGDLAGIGPKKKKRKPISGGL